MNNKYLISILLLIFIVKGYAQNPKLEDLIKLRNMNLVDFQEYMYENGFLFYKANGDKKNKTDTISFINKQKVMTGFIVLKKGNTVFVENIKEGYFKELNTDLKSPNFVLLETKAKANILKKIYLDKITDNSIEVSIISDTKASDSLKNTYKVIVSKPTKHILKKYSSQINN